MQQKQTGSHTEEEFFFKALISRWIGSVRYTLGFWKILVWAGLLGAIGGIVTSLLTPVTYTARLTFVVEDTKQGGGSLVSALAGQIGLDVGSLGNTSGMLAGDNVLELLKSRSLIKKTLLTPYTGTDTNYSLADRFAETYGWKEKWKNSSKVGKDIHFTVNKTSFTRLEDSLLQRLIKKITEDQLSIAKPDKKLNFFELTYVNRDEKVSQLFCERLLKTSADFYIETKTRRLRGNIARLQRNLDSLGGVLDKKTYSAAQASEGLIDINPAYTTQAVSAEISSRNKFIQGTIYGELVKQLEVSKTSLIQETPTVQTVDYPEMPLKKNRLRWYVGLLAGAAIATFLAGLLIMFNQKEEEITTA